MLEMLERSVHLLPKANGKEAVRGRGFTLHRKTYAWLLQLHLNTALKSAYHIELESQ